MNINYFLVEANRFKLNNYVKIPTDYIMELISYIYDGNAMANLSKKFIKGSVEENGKRYFYFNKDHKTNNNSKAYNLINTQKYLATMANNTIVKQIYILSFTDNAYKELAFVMFLLGVVNTEDYLTMNRDISYIVSRFVVKPSRREIYANKGIIITLQDYLTLMALYYKNAVKGVRYGVNPFDFVYNAYNKAKAFSNNALEQVLTAFGNVLENPENLPNLSDTVFNKYDTELAIISGVTKLSEEEKMLLIDHFLRKGDYIDNSIFLNVVSQTRYIELNDAGAVKSMIG